MPKKATVAVVALALLLVLAFLFHRAPREQKPSRAEPRADPIAAPESPPASAPPVKTAAAAATQLPPPSAAVQGLPGTVQGTVKILDEIPPRNRVKLDVDPKCESLHAGVVLSDELVADANGNVQWAFVRVTSGPIGVPPPVPKTPVLMDQIRCVFTPHMVGVRVGQPVRVTSSDDLLHNVHSLPFENREFNVGLPQAGMDVVRTFDKPEIFVIKCDVHPWMRAWVGVVEHSYWSITNELGTYVIRDLPPGKFTIEVWHEKYKPVTREVQVPPGGDVALDFVLDEKRD
jgi:plastocyanin